MSKDNEWDLLKRRFDASMHDESASAESIYEIFDFQFCRRFTELIIQTAQRNSTTVNASPIDVGEVDCGRNVTTRRMRQAGFSQLDWGQSVPTIADRDSIGTVLPINLDFIGFFTLVMSPESGHVQCTGRCPLRANSGHSATTARYPLSAQ